jgi:hypothetical protein
MFTCLTCRRPVGDWAAAKRHAAGCARGAVLFDGEAAARDVLGRAFGAAARRTAPGLEERVARIAAAAGRERERAKAAARARRELLKAGPGLHLVGS